VEKDLSNSDIAQTIFTTMNNRDLSDLEQYLSENAVFDFPGAGIIKGRKRILIFFKVLFKKYTRLTFTVEDIVSEGERVCAIWSNEGEDKKGNPYRNRGVTLVNVSDGKIVFISDYFKDTSFVEAS
jgi:ketosteroid isomerase-like protein